MWDLETDLISHWSPTGDPTTDTRDWFTAHRDCNNRRAGNPLGWRLLTLQELASLVDKTQFNPGLPDGYPFINVQPSPYWSAATVAKLPNAAWVVSFALGGVTTSPKSDRDRVFVWCMRGGNGEPDAQ